MDDAECHFRGIQDKIGSVSVLLGFPFAKLDSCPEIQVKPAAHAANYVKIRLNRRIATQSVLVLQNIPVCVGP